MENETSQRFHEVENPKASEEMAIQPLPVWCIRRCQPHIPPFCAPGIPLGVKCVWNANERLELPRALPEKCEATFISPSWKKKVRDSELVSALGLLVVGLSVSTQPQEAETHSAIAATAIGYFLVASKALFHYTLKHQENDD